MRILFTKFKKILNSKGGSGITPMFQLVKEICSKPDDTTTIKLIYANQVNNPLRRAVKIIPTKKT